MNTDQLKHLLSAVAAGQTSIDAAADQLRQLPFQSLDCATIDHHRALRCGLPEVIFCPGKHPDHVVQIARHLAAQNLPVLATRANADQLAQVRSAFPEVLVDDLSHSFMLNPPAPLPPRNDDPFIAVISAGTADLPVAHEALFTLRATRTPCVRIVDVGVSGLHRLLAHLPTLQRACAVIVVAGMEGALPSVVGGLVSCPVFAVPTSVGYGASFNGLAALLGMLNSCASAVSVLNIDNGFGAAYSASLVYQQVTKHLPKSS
ncbi:MAG TPA: nickel pincer cofactor biosynthesis protein LarB [Tepidisphaeraceae bacterium]|nr:nickel pincer cofactor biosynthesis protein LarB [Tepidisphaeraceae bacterium]